MISPHLDDAVFSCGQWLGAHPGAMVVTVFAGMPRDASRLTVWDRHCGFGSAGEAMQMRREEDHRALTLLGAQPHWLDFTDSQYGETPTLGEVALALQNLLQALRPPSVLFPLGLFHSDHHLVHEASMTALRHTPGASAWAYEDCLYRALPGLLQERLAALHEAGMCATPVRWHALENGPLKEAAVRAYESQLRAFGPQGYDDTRRPERYWELMPRAGDARERDGEH